MGVYAEVEKQEIWYIIISRTGPKPLKTEIYLLNRKLAVPPPKKTYSLTMIYKSVKTDIFE